MDEFRTASRDLKAFNRMVIGHPVLSARLTLGDHDYLQWRQAKLFVAFRERHRPGRAASSAAPPAGQLLPLLKRALAGLDACLLTAFALIAGRKDVAIFSIDKISAEKDHDFRLDGIYRFLGKRGLSSVEIFHAQLDGTLFRHFKSRRRAAVYREAFEFLFSVMARFSRSGDARRLVDALPCAEFDEAERPFVRGLVEKLLNGIEASRFEIRRYRSTLRRLRPRAILSIDDTRHYQELCAAARAEGVPIYVFQHGHFTGYHAGWLSTGGGTSAADWPDAFFVWSPYWKKELLRLGTCLPESTIRIGGNPKGDAPPVDAPAYAPPGEGTLGLLVPFESDAPFDEMKPIMRDLLAGGGLKIWLKTRPDRDVAEQLRSYGLDGLPPERAEAVSDHRPILDRVHAVAGVWSTFLYDIIVYRKPVFILKTSMDAGEGMIMNGLADQFDATAADPSGRLRALCREAASKLEKRAETYLGGGVRLEETLEGLLPPSGLDARP